MGDEGTGVSIRPFRAGDGEAFRVLNEAWIGRLFGIEEKDRSTLGDPEGNILARGGHILMAAEGEAAVGCCALILVRSGVYEVAKMTVVESHRGRGLGRKLLAHTIAQAKALGAKKLYLETNSSLSDAIHLYEALGFRHLPPERAPHSDYVRADVFMEMGLQPGGRGCTIG
jgi:GNAT superfamily N-acetyltransferase